MAGLEDFFGNGQDPVVDDNGGQDNQNADNQQQQGVTPNDDQDPKKDVDVKDHDDKDGQENKTIDSDDIYHGIAQLLKEEGIIDINPDEVNGENFKDKLKGYIEQQRVEAMQQMLQALPQDVAVLVEYTLQGGDPKEMLPLLLMNMAVASVSLPLKMCLR